MKHTWKKKGIAAVLAALLLTAGLTALAAAGTSDNPLVTLSYLTGTFTDTVLSKTQSAIASAQSTYESKLDDKISALQGSSGGGTSSAFTVVSLSKDQVLTGSVGCEVMLRVGTAVCISDSTPGLIDTTTGGTLESSGSLVKNHLYMITMNQRGVKATAASVKILARGPYTIS